MAALNQRKWQEDLTLVRRLIDRKLLAFHGVRNWNPDIDGWWIIKALLDDVRRGARLAIKGPRADLFPPPHSTPLRNLAARAVGLANGEPVLPSQHDPALRHIQLTAARPAIYGGNLTDDGLATTLLGDAQPFHYQPDMPNGDAMELAGSEGRPRNNFAQNKQTNDVARILRLTPDQAQQLHYELGSEPPMGFHEIMERAKDMFNLR
ncbi:hypothetical protein [Paraburkholderia monticola]|uniref:hypothetical protein n=1 Tax=Paraburkholderia monticola TaxID=1399968 RepID=UPI001F4D2999|nr:hypothetical protein [Paraburkholderia monticola]